MLFVFGVEFLGHYRIPQKSKLNDSWCAEGLEPGLIRCPVAPPEASPFSRPRPLGRPTGSGGYNARPPNAGAEGLSPRERPKRGVRGNSRLARKQTIIRLNNRTFKGGVRRRGVARERRAARHAACKARSPWRSYVERSRRAGGQEGRQIGETERACAFHPQMSQPRRFVFFTVKQTT